jgi:hypothetical protein
MFSEVTEVRDAVHLLTPRAINADVARDLIREMRWYDEYLDRGYADRSANPRRATSAAAYRTWWKGARLSGQGGQLRRWRRSRATGIA